LARGRPASRRIDRERIDFPRHFLKVGIPGKTMPKSFLRIYSDLFAMPVAFAGSASCKLGGVVAIMQAIIPRCRHNGGSRGESSCVGRPPGPAGDQPQEKPDLVEQPDKAPAGIDELPDEIRKLAAEMVFLTFRLPHLPHSTSMSLADELISTSKFALQSLHLYS
jgi:hypothetical protein